MLDEEKCLHHNSYCNLFTHSDVITVLHGRKDNHCFQYVTQLWAASSATQNVMYVYHNARTDCESNYMRNRKYLHFILTVIRIVLELIASHLPKLENECIHIDFASKLSLICI